MKFAHFYCKNIQSIKSEWEDLKDAFCEDFLPAILRLIVQLIFCTCRVILFFIPILQIYFCFKTEYVSVDLVNDENKKRLVEGYYTKESVKRFKEGLIEMAKDSQHEEKEKANT